MTVTITQDIRDIGNVPDNVTVRFGSPVPRGSGSSLITTKWTSFTAVAGILTAVVEPGPAKVMIRHVGTFTITIPNTDSDLWSLISAAVGIPPTTPGDLLAQAVSDYFAAHPAVEWESYANLAAFPATGNGAKEYLAQDTGKLYRWNGSSYVQIADKAAVGLGNVDNVSDINKPVSTAQQAALDGKQAVLTATAVKTTTYTAAVSDLIPADATSAPFTITLPSAPADKARIVVKKIDATTNAVTVTRGGSDVFNTPGGSTSLTLQLQYQAIQLQYKASSAIWYVVSTDAPLVSTDARYAFTRTGYGVAALGDSKTANYGDSTQLREMEGALSRACAELGQNPMFRGTFATGGYTLSQILSTWVPTVLALNPKPWACVIDGGTNDAGASAGVGFSVTTTLATLKTICDLLVAGNIRPIIATLTPRGDVTLVNQNVSNYNRALWRFAITNGYDVVDYNKAVVNPATGGFLTGYAQSDLIHPDYKAVKAMGQELAATLSGMQAPFYPALRASHSLDPTNLLGAQGHFQVDTNSDGKADGFSNAVPRGATFTVVNDPDGVTKWQRILQPSTATGNNLLQKTISSAVAAGDTIEAVARVQTSGFDDALVAPTGLTGGTGPSWAFTVGLTGATHDLEPAYNWHTDLSDGYVYLRGVVPSGATGAITINLQVGGVPVSGSCWVQFTEVCVRNLTTLGLL